MRYVCGLIATYEIATHHVDPLLSLDLELHQLRKNWMFVLGLFAWSYIDLYVEVVHIEAPPVVLERD